MKTETIVLCWVAVTIIWSINGSQSKDTTAFMCHFILYECTCELMTYGYDVLCTELYDWNPLLQIFRAKLGNEVINRLFMKDSNITTIGENDLKGIRLAEIDFDACVIGEIDDNAFSVVDQLNEIRWVRMTDMIKIPTAVSKTNLEVVRLTNGGLKTVEKQLQHMTSLYELDLSYNRITYIDPEAFTNCSNMKTVDISYNNIQQLDIKLFRNSRRLTTVYITFNQLSSIKGLLAPSKSSMLTLWLNANNFTNFTEALYFDSPVRMVELSIADNPFRIVTRSQFDIKFQKLVLFILRNTSLQEIEDHSFDALVELKLISLSHNNLTSLPEDLFAKNLKLREIRLDHNNIRNISRLFLKTTSLGRLYLSSNKIKDIDGSFNSLSKIQYIFLDNNQIQKISAGTFASTSSLTRLHLYNNKILSLTSGSFNGVRSVLQVLDLTNNSLANLENEFSEKKIPTKLLYLHLGWNRLSSISQSDFDLKKLVYLDLVNNSVSALSKAFVGIKKLQVLILAGNNLSTILEKNFYDYKTLQRLHVQDNPLTCDCRLLWIKNWQNATNILEASLCAEPHWLLGKQFQNMTKEQLNDWPDDCPTNCNWCRCFSTENGVFVNVSCDGRNLSSVPNTLPKLTRSLNLSLNYLKLIPETFAQTLPNLRILDLRGNYLESLNNVQLSRDLKELDISSNKLRRFPAHLRNNMNLTKGSFSRNPWICDCEAEPFRTWLLKNYRVIPNINQTNCSDDKLRGRVMTSLLETDLCPLQISVYIFIAIGVLACLLGASSAFITYIRYQMPIKVWLYSKKLCLRCVKEEDIDEDKDFDAFIAFHFDEQRCVNHLLERLENVDPHYSICVHYRDFLGGELILENITRAVGRSKRIIILLSRSFLESKWTMCEFREAHRQLMVEKLNRIIMVLVGQIPPVDELPDDVRAFINTFTYLRWEDKYFWQKLLYAMPKTPIVKEGAVNWESFI